MRACYAACAAICASVRSSMRLTGRCRFTFRGWFSSSLGPLFVGFRRLRRGGAGSRRDRGYRHGGHGHGGGGRDGGAHGRRGGSGRGGGSDGTLCSWRSGFQRERERLAGLGPDHASAAIGERLQVFERSLAAKHRLVEPLGPLAVFLEKLRERGRLRSERRLVVVR